MKSGRIENVARMQSLDAGMKEAYPNNVNSEQFCVLGSSRATFVP